MRLCRAVRKRWIRFYRDHRELCDCVGVFIGVLIMVAFMYLLYVGMWVIGA